MQLLQSASIDRAKVDETFWERTVFYYKTGAFHEIEYGQLINDDAHIKNGLKYLSKALR